MDPNHSSKLASNLSVWVSQAFSLAHLDDSPQFCKSPSPTHSHFVTPALCRSVASDTPGVFESYKTENDGKIQALEAKVESIAQDIRKRDAIQNKEIGDIRAHVSTVEQKICRPPLVDKLHHCLTSFASKIKDH